MSARWSDVRVKKCFWRNGARKHLVGELHVPTVINAAQGRTRPGHDAPTGQWNSLTLALRDLLRLFRETLLLAQDLPVTSKVIDAAIAEVGNDFRVSIER